MHVDLEILVTAVAARLATYMKEDAADPEYTSQRQAFKKFGEANVLRWRDEGKIEPIKRPGILHYKTSELKELSRVKQDYFELKDYSASES